MVVEHPVAQGRQALLRTQGRVTASQSSQRASATAAANSLLCSSCPRARPFQYTRRGLSPCGSHACRRTHRRPAADLLPSGAPPPPTAGLAPARCRLAGTPGPRRSRSTQVQQRSRPSGYTLSMRRRPGRYQPRPPTGKCRRSSRCVPGLEVNLRGREPSPALENRPPGSAGDGAPPAGTGQPTSSAMCPRRPPALRRRRKACAARGRRRRRRRP
jgi:hypothetical protein